MSNTYLKNCFTAGARIFKDTDSLSESLPFKLIFSIIFTLLMCVSASTFFYLPFTPVPITMQVFTVLLSGIILGKYWALSSQVLYILMGACGLPVFSGFKDIYTAFPGPTGGYIIGFAVSAYVTGLIYEKISIKTNRQELICFLIRKKNNENKNFKIASCNKISFKKSIFIFTACFTGFLVIHFCGFLHLAGYFYSMNHYRNIPEIIIRTVKLGFGPFILFDLLKIMIIVSLQKMIKF